MLRKCPECGWILSSTAEKCAGCGAIIENNQDHFGDVNDDGPHFELKPEEPSRVILNVLCVKCGAKANRFFIHESDTYYTNMIRRRIYTSCDSKRANVPLCNGCYDELTHGKKKYGKTKHTIYNFLLLIFGIVLFSWRINISTQLIELIISVPFLVFFIITLVYTSYNAIQKSIKNDCSFKYVKIKQDDKVFIKFKGESPWIDYKEWFSKQEPVQIVGYLS